MFLAWSALLPRAFSAPASASIPVGLEMYSVRESLKKDLQATIRAVAKMGYQGLEFYAPYFEWSESQTKQTRSLLDDLGVRCFSTHNDEDYLNARNISKTSDRNSILGSKYVVQASSTPKVRLEQWKTVADGLNAAAENVASAGLGVGYHNHQAEFTAVEGKRPMEILAENTRPSIMLQLDVGTCIEAGTDPVAWIRANPGRIRSIHCKDWSPERARGYTVLFGEGVADWKNIFAACESGGGVEYYLVEQEGSRFPELDTARQCLKSFQGKHAG
jgi:sugar phosphate isomerase/epimerase